MHGDNGCQRVPTKTVATSYHQKSPLTGAGITLMRAPASGLFQYRRRNHLSASSADTTSHFTSCQCTKSQTVCQGQKWASWAFGWCTRQGTRLYWLLSRSRRMSHADGSALLSAPSPAESVKRRRVAECAGRCGPKRLTDPLLPLDLDVGHRLLQILDTIFRNARFRKVELLQARESS